MNKYKIIFSYDGSDFKGYQTQPGKRTVQECIENALKFINDKKTALYASGRTDARVHALRQTGHFYMDKEVSSYKLKRAINSNTPEDIHIINIEKVDDSFNARFDVVEKHYVYKINIGEYNPIERNYIYQYNWDLNIKEMKKAIKYLKGTHDFRSFVSENKDKENCIRTIRKAYIKKRKNYVEINFIGNGFLKYQVRNMVGYLIKIGEEKEDYKNMKIVIKSKNRSKAGKTAPAVGLYLKNVKY